MVRLQYPILALEGAQTRNRREEKLENTEKERRSINIRREYGSPQKDRFVSGGEGGE
jgi:hypothetical protein